MPKLVNPLTVLPPEIAPGDVMVVTVTCHIVKHGDELRFRTYRCDYPPQTYDGIPQGNRVLDIAEGDVVRALFPVVTWAGIRQDLP